MKSKPELSAPASVTVIAGQEPSRGRRLLVAAGLVLAGGVLGLGLRSPTAAPAVVIAQPPPIEPVVAGIPVVDQPQPPALAPQVQASRVEIAFVLDTTGSMGGMLKAAKQKIWQIANEFADAQPQPKISIGLVAFRDQGDAYLTQFVPLTEDLDAFYATLQALRPMGGGDTPEAVDEGLHVAMSRLQFSDDANLRMLFLVGDASPHAEKRQRCQQIVSEARAKGLLVNTIQCGTASDTQRDWTQIASAGGGNYLQIDQNAKVVAVSTPFDDAILKVQRRIEGTAIFYGTTSQQEISKDQWTLNGSLGAEEYASRSCYQSKTGSYYQQDLLNALGAGRVQLATLKKEQLPAELQKLSPAARIAKVADLRAQRAAAQAELQKLVGQRDGFVRDNHATGDTFDRKLVDCLKSQARASGLTFPADK